MASKGTLPPLVHCIVDRTRSQRQVNFAAGSSLVSYEVNLSHIYCVYGATEKGVNRGD
jgi:hypothetical protein